MTFDNAFNLCRRHHPDVNPIPAFLTQLRKYEVKCWKLGVISGTGNVKSSKKRKSPPGPSRGPVIGPSWPKQGAAIGPSLPPGDELRSEFHENMKKKAKADGRCEEEQAIDPSIGPMNKPCIAVVKDVAVARADANKVPSSVDKGD